MMRWWIPALLLGAAAFLGPPAGADEKPASDLLAVVRRHADPQSFQEAVAALRRLGPEAGVLLDAELAKQSKRAERDWSVLTRRLNAHAPDAEESRVAAKVREAWEVAAARARAWIFDEQAFPVPARAVITGPMEGYEEAKQRGDDAVRAWRRLTKVLSRELGRVLRLDAEEAQGLLQAHADAEACRLRITEARTTSVDVEAAKAVRPLALDLLALRTGAFLESAERYEAEGDPWTRVCLFYAYVRTVEDANVLDATSETKQAQAGLAALNRYRTALGISPVRHNAKLARMATEHAEEMMRLGYFSHRSPMPERETKEKRAVLVGYEGRIVECITGGKGPEGAIEFWKYDGGHHRDMIAPRWAEGGFSAKGNMVYDGGSGEPGAVPVIHYGTSGE